jgi:hypothetical protein
MLEAVVASTPDDARAWHLLGTARYVTGRLGPAVDAYRRRLALAPNDPDTHYALAIALRDEARQHLRQAVQLRPGFQQARQRLLELERPSSPDRTLPGLSPSSPPPPRSPPPGPSPASPPPDAAVSAGGIVGRARAIQLRSQQDLWLGRGVLERLTFRVERTDEAGNLLPPIPVEIRGARISGTISEGDWVEVRGRRRRDGTVRATRIQNLTTSETIRARNVLRWVALALVGLFVIAFLLFAAWVGSNLFAARSTINGPSPVPVTSDTKPTPTTHSTTTRQPTTTRHQTTTTQATTTTQPTTTTTRPTTTTPPPGS